MNQIIKQPNGKYCIFSTIVDHITYYNMSKRGLIELMVKSETKRIEARIEEKIEEIESGRKNQFTKSFDEVLKIIEEVHGQNEVIKLKQAIE